MRQTRSTAAPAVVLLMLAFSCAAASYASDGRIPVYEATTISEPGSYYLTQEVAGDVGIEAADVTLDLNGFRISGDVGVTGTARVRISGGRVLGAIIGANAFDLSVERVEAGRITLVNATNPTIELVKCGGMMLTNVTGGRVARCTVRDGVGIWLFSGGGCEVVDNAVSGTTIALTNGGNSHIVSRNTVTGSSAYGITIDTSNNNRVTGNTVRSCTFSGIHLNASHGNQVAENDVSACGSGDAPYGVWLVGSTMNELSRNMVHDSAGSGIRLSAGSWGNSLVYNSANSNGASGILVETDDNALDWNVANGNGSVGIRVTGVRNVLSHNRALGNVTASWDVSCGTNYCVHYYDSGFPMGTNMPGLP